MMKNSLFSASISTQSLWWKRFLAINQFYNYNFNTLQYSKTIFFSRLSEYFFQIQLKT